jgi:hypothetical protein
MGLLPPQETGYLILPQIAAKITNRLKISAEGKEYESPPRRAFKKTAGAII